MKRLISLAIMASIALSYALPAMAIEDSNAKTTEVKTEKIKPLENKYNYINLAWWQGFNDEYLNSYIVKAIENNKDLKMATLTIDEFYQNIVAQRASQLPTINAGFFDPKNQQTVSYIINEDQTVEDPIFNSDLMLNPVLRKNMKGNALQTLTI